MADDPPSGVTDTSWRTGNVGALLFAATDRCVRHKLQVLDDCGFGSITDAQLALFLHLDVEGARLTSVASRASLTKQSMVELVDKAAAAGYVERLADPADKRAKMVRFTDAGLHALDALHLGIAAVEEQVASAVGQDFLRRMREILGDYAGLPAPGDATRRGANVGRVLALSARRFADETLRLIQRRGYTQVSDVLLTLFRVLDLEGTRLTDLAARAHVTKQSMREAVDRAEMLGLVARRPDPHDRRAKVIAFTTDGLALLEQARLSLAETEALMATSCGSDFLAELKVRLAIYNGAAMPTVASGADLTHNSGRGVASKRRAGELAGAPALEAADA